MVLILFLISVACFVALIGAGVAIVRHIRADHSNESASAPPKPTFTQHLYVAAEYGSTRAPRQVRHQTVKGITAKKAWNVPSQSIEIHPTGEDQPVAGKRKPPQPAQVQRAHFISERVDWAHFNKDYGDLSDP